MPQDPSILQELNELAAHAIRHVESNVYQVPVGYFDGLPSAILQRVKALDANSASEELAVLSPFINSISREMPYNVPTGYFQELEPFIDDLQQEESASEELQSLSSMLGGLKKKMPYSVPDGYFDNLNSAVADTKVVKMEPKVIKMNNRKWFNYAAAAIVTGVIALSAFFFYNKKETLDPNKASYAWVEKNMNKVSNDEINKFVELTDPAVPALAVNTSSNDVKELMKNVSDKDIQEFLKETDASADDADDDLLFN